MDNPTLLIDFDGVLKVEGKLALGVQDFFSFLNQTKIDAIILSNSTLMTGKNIEQFFIDNGIKNYISAITTVDIALNYIELNKLTVKVYCDDRISSLFTQSNEQPDAVIVGDIGERWNFKLMNEIFNYVNSGSSLIALHKNKYWKNNEGRFVLDAGAFISAIEFSTGKQSKILGKPSPLYFDYALKKLERKIENGFIMIGDDIENDVKAAQDIGGKGILIYTGKTKFPYNKKLNITPDYEAKDLFEVIEILKRITSL